MTLVKRLTDWINTLDRNLVPIIGTPGSGKSYFLASLTKWALHKLDTHEKIFLEGGEYLFGLAVKLATIEVNPDTRIITGGIERNFYSEAEQGMVPVRLRLPESIVGENAFDIFTIDGPGEILVSRPDLLQRIVRRMKGLILLVDVVGEEAREEVDWAWVGSNARASIQGLGKVVSGELEEGTPVALVITKADRLLSLKSFREKQDREKSWQLVKAQVENIYLPILQQHNAKIILHSSIGTYSSLQEALSAGSSMFPYPMNVEKVLEHFLVDRSGSVF